MPPRAVPKLSAESAGAANLFFRLAEIKRFTLQRLPDQPQNFWIRQQPEGGHRLWILALRLHLGHKLQHALTALGQGLLSQFFHPSQPRRILPDTLGHLCQLLDLVFGAHGWKHVARKDINSLETIRRNKKWTVNNGKQMPAQGILAPGRQRLFSPGSSPSASGFFGGWPIVLGGRRAFIQLVTKSLDKHRGAE